MWEWREDSARGRWRLGATGSWIWDEPADLDRYAEDRDGLTRALPAGGEPGSWVATPAWGATPSWVAERSWLPSDDAVVGSRPYLDAAAGPDADRGPGEGWRWVREDVGEDPWSATPVGDSAFDAVIAGRTVVGADDRALVEAEPTPIFAAVAEDRDGGGGAHAADGPRAGGRRDPVTGDLAIPSPTPGSGPLPVQRLEGLRGAGSPEAEMRRRARRRRSAYGTDDDPDATGDAVAVGAVDAGRTDDAGAGRGRHAVGVPVPASTTSRRHGRD